MASPVVRDDSAFLQFRKRIPADVLAKARGRRIVVELPAVGVKPAVTILSRLAPEVKFSLRTADPSEAKVRMASATATLGTVLDGIRQGPKPLTHKQLVALSGDVYRAFLDHYGDQPDGVDRWSAFKAFSRAIREGRIGLAPTASLEEAESIEKAVKLFGADLTAGINTLPRGEAKTDALELRFGFLATWTLMRHSLTVDAETRAKLILEVDRASTDAAWRLKRAAEGDYSPDPKEQRFPAFEEAKPAVTLARLFDRWVAETKPAPSTLMTTRGIVTKLNRHIGGATVGSITTEQIVAWKDALLASGEVAPKTVNATYLAMMSALFNWGVTNSILKANPAKGVKVAAKAQAGTSMLPYSDDEVARLLTLARLEERPAYRWLPWLAAATGARIGELAQAWGANIETVHGVPVLHIRPAPDAGTLKTESSERTVPLHPALITEGFLTFAASKGSGPLFYGRSSGRPATRHASKGTANHLSTWIREQPGFDDPRKAPNHALRHWWKTAAFRAGVPDSIADFLQGHRSPSVASKYRHFDIPTLGKAVAAVPIPLSPKAIPAL